MASEVPVPEDDASPHPTVTDRPDERDFDAQPVLEIASGLRVPRLGLGTWQLEGRTAADSVAEALRLGYRHIDTAQAYGNEDQVAAGIAASGMARDELFITTKIDNDKHRPGDLVTSVDESLARLDTDHVDLLLIHWPVEWDIIGATLSTLAQVHASGKALHIGVSNFTVAQLDQVADLAPLEVLQVECHPFLQQRELRQWCVDHDWVFTAYSPVARGKVFGNDTLASIGAAHGVGEGAVALAWLVGQTNVVAIPRSSKPDHLAKNWSTLELELSDDERRRIDALDSGDRLVDPGDIAPWER